MICLQRRGNESRPPRQVNILLLMLVGLMLPAVVCALTPQEERGKHIYFKGTSPSGGTINAFFGKDLIEMPGERALCSGCHGYDGLGRPESGVVPTNITWQYLMKSYGHVHPDGLEHPAFTVESLKSYMKDGIYPGGRKGDPSMPVYAMPEEDLDDLISYLRLLGSESIPGLGDEVIRIGTIIPGAGPTGEMGEVMSRTVRAYFDRINEKGGLYNRRLELVVEKIPEKPAPTGGKPVSLLRGKQWFALVNTMIPGPESETAAAAEAEAEAIPLIGPFTLFPVGAFAMNRHVFYIFPGLKEQARSLINFASRELKIEGAALMIVSDSGKDPGAVAASAEELATEKGWKVFRREYAPAGFNAREIIRQAEENNAGLVMALGSESGTAALIKELHTLKRVPYMLVPGVLMGRGVYDVPSGLRDRIFFSYPTIPEDRRERGMAELADILKKGAVPFSYPAAQVAAYTAAQVLVEGLRRAGRELSREKLVSALEGLYEFETGLAPPITYGRNRRIGLLGAYIVTLGKEGAFFSSKKWVSAE